MKNSGLSFLSVGHSRMVSRSLFTLLRNYFFKVLMASELWAETLSPEIRSWFSVLLFCEGTERKLSDDDAADRLLSLL